MSRRRNNPASGSCCAALSLAAACGHHSRQTPGSGPAEEGGQEFFLPASSVAPWESRAEDPACNKAFFCLTLFWEETLSIYNVSGTIVSAFCI